MCPKMGNTKIIQVILGGNHNGLGGLGVRKFHEIPIFMTHFLQETLQAPESIRTSATLFAALCHPSWCKETGADLAAAADPDIIRRSPGIDRHIFRWKWTRHVVTFALWIFHQEALIKHGMPQSPWSNCGSKYRFDLIWRPAGKAGDGGYWLQRNFAPIWTLWWSEIGLPGPHGVRISQLMVGPTKRRT